LTKPLKDYPSTDLRQDLHQRSTIRRFLAYGTVLDRYLFRELILPFIVGVAAFLVIILGHTL